MMTPDRISLAAASQAAGCLQEAILRGAAESMIPIYAHVTRCPVKEQLEPWSGEIQLEPEQAGDLAVSPSAHVILTQIETEDEV